MIPAKKCNKGKIIVRYSMLPIDYKDKLKILCKKCPNLQLEEKDFAMEESSI